MKITIIFIIAFFPLLVFAQITFEKGIGGKDYNQGNAIQQTKDGGYIIAGNCRNNDEESNIYLVKTNEYGDTVWTKTYGDIAWNGANAVLELEDGGYIVAATTETYDDEYSSAYLIKTDEDGDTVWTKTFSKGHYCRAQDIQRTLDEGYIVAGSVQYYNPESNDFYLLKTDSLGDSIWTKTYGGDEADRAASVQQTSDEGYIIAGYTESFGEGSSDLYVVKTDSIGDTLWTRTYGGPDLEIGSSVIKTVEGGYLIAGYTKSFGAGYQDAYIVKIDSVGDTLWTNTFGGWKGDYGKAVCQTKDNEFILAGNSATYATDPYGYDAYIIKTDENGDSLWTKVYGGWGIDGFLDVKQTEDNGYIFVGSTSTFGNGDQNIYLVKTNENGILTDITEYYSKIPFSNVLNQNYPNPFNPKTTISYTIGAYRDKPLPYVDLSIYNILGQKVITLVSEKQAPGKYAIEWNAAHFPSGIYYCQIKAGKFKDVKKMVLIK